MTASEGFARPHGDDLPAAIAPGGAANGL